MTHPSGIVQTMATLFGTGEKVPVKDAIRLVSGLAAQVSAIHAAGRIHRGITPGAVALETGFSPVLCDVNAVDYWEHFTDAGEWLSPELGGCRWIKSRLRSTPPSDICGRWALPWIHGRSTFTLWEHCGVGWSRANPGPPICAVRE